MLNKDELEVAAKVMRAFSHPLRLAVLQVLQDGQLNVTELYETLECSQSMMSQQLRILESQGLIKTHKEGTVKYYEIRNNDFLELFHCMKNHLELYFKIQSEDTSFIE